MKIIKRLFADKLFVAIDAANLESSIKDLGWWIDYKKLKKLFPKKNLVFLRYYCVAHYTKSQDDFFTFLKHAGYKLITKPIKIIKHKKTIIRKANFDVEITADVLSNIDKFNILVLFSGDSDFAYLLKLLKQKGKRTIVISTKHHISKELISEAYKYIDLKKLKELIERKRR